jgi:exopolyphosphatase/pppGpp-phosphohydrolase
MNAEEAQKEVVALLQAHERRPRHVFHVANLALQMFDGLVSLHGLGDRDRLILESAALLHDIGATGPDRDEHHKESARLIRDNTWGHFTDAEVQVMASVARYHRRSPPKADHEEFASLSAEDQRKVEVLGALLRVADGLDRSHERLVSRVTVEIGTGQIVFRLGASPDAIQELEAAKRKSDLAQNVFQRDILFVIESDAG